MLTKQDLIQIGNVVEEKLEEKLEQKLEQKLEPIRQEIKKIDKKLTTTINFFDHLTLNHERRLVRLEKHTGFPPIADY